MQSGDIFTDRRGDAWVLDGVLGRGSWGTTWTVKGEDGTLAVLKVPHDRAALGDADGADELAEACARAAVSLRDQLRAGRHGFLPQLLGEVALDDGRVALLFPRYASSLEARLGGGMPLADAIDLVVRVLQRLADAGAVVHGNLRPSNVLLDGGGAPILSDPLVEPLAGVFRRLEGASRGRSSYLPPEARSRADGSWDTWALALALFRAASAPGVSDEAGSRRPELPREGLGRVALASLKDAAAARLKAERANARFTTRATAALGTVLNRALSAESEPSPPYRFRSARELLERLAEVHDLLRPRVEGVSRVLLGPAAREGVFEGGDTVAFSVNVGTTAGVTQEDIAVGVQLHDLDAPGDGRVRVEHARFSADRYPSGKWRFEFLLPDVPPGRYRVRVAFAVKGAEGEPEVAEDQLEVRPRPGYVPPPAPADDDPPPALVLPRRDRDDDDHDDAPRQAGSLVDLAAARRPSPPRPIRPSDDDEPSPAPRPPAPVQAQVQAPFPAAAPTSPGTSPDLEPRPVSPSPRPVVALSAPARPGVTVAATSPGADTVPGVETADWSPPRPTSPSVPRIAVAPRVDVTAAAPAPPPTAPPTELPSAGIEPLDDLDPLLHDYPAPSAGGAELPSYDLGEPRASARPLDALRDQVVQRLTGDAAFALAGAGVVLACLVIFALKSC